MLTSKAHLQLGPLRAVMPDLPAREACLVAEILDPPISTGCKAVPLNTTEGAGHAFSHVWATVISLNDAAAWDKIHQPLERGLHGVKVDVDVCVVELDRRQDQPIREIVEKLWALVEEGRIVLIALEDEGARGAKLEARGKVLGHAADQERWCE